MAKSIKFDEGFKEYDINGDPNRIIKVDTADYGLIERFEEADKRIKKQLDKYKGIKIKSDGSAEMSDKEACRAIAELSQTIKDAVNYIFDYDVSPVVFGNRSPLSTRKGVPLFERFMNAIMPIIKADIEAEAKESNKRIQKYSAQAAKYKRGKK